LDFKLVESLIIGMYFRLSLLQKCGLNLHLASDTTGPSGYVEEPKASCPFAVAAAHAPKISEPE
jgi:hypothetical protein